MRSMLDSEVREQLLHRLRGLQPDASPRWGHMTAPQMVAHLTDQMRHTLGDARCAPIRSLLRLPVLHTLGIYVVPWPKGKVKGPPEAFTTQPQQWPEDLARLEALVLRFAQQDPAGPWPNHAMFGRMSRRDWGRFCFRHFDHHLRQFGR